MAKKQKTPQAPKPPKNASKPDTEIKNKLKEYLNGIEKNFKNDPYIIAYGYVLGTLLSHGDYECQTITREHIFNCKSICDDSRLYEALVDNGGDANEVQLIRLADKFKQQATFTEILRPYIQPVIEEHFRQIAGVKI